MRTFYGTLILLFFAFVPLAFSEDAVSNEDLLRAINRLQATVSSLETRLTYQQKRIDHLESENVALKLAKGQPTSGQVPAQSPTISQGRTSGSLTPDIGLVGDVLAKFTESKSDEEGNDRISLRHLELVMGHDVDPYSRLDATVAFSDSEDPKVEEAYLTYFDLPYHTLAKIGRFSPRVGISASMHLDSLDTSNQPLVVEELFGPDGYFRSGIELSNFLPSASDSITHEAIVGVVEGGTGGEGRLFGETRRNPTVYARLKNSWDLSEDTIGTLGGTFLEGSADSDSGFEARAIGLDSSVITHLSGEKRLKFQSEAYLQDRSAPCVDTTSEGAAPGEFRRHPVGFYTLGDFKFASRWAAGGRFDFLQPIERASDADRSFNYQLSAYLTFFQSEFARFRFQYGYLSNGDGSDDNRVFLQSTFAIGQHKHLLQ